MPKHLNLAAAVMLTSLGGAMVASSCAHAQQTTQGMERKSQNRTTRTPEPAKRHGCNASGHGTRKDCAHTRKPPRGEPKEIDQDRVGMNMVTPPKPSAGDQ